MQGVTLTDTSVNPYEQNSAAAFAWHSGLKTEAIKGYDNLCVTHIRDGDWLAVANVDFGEAGVLRFTAKLASPTGGEIEIRLDSPQGEIAGLLSTGSTGDENSPKLCTCDVKAIGGVHHIFFVFKGDSDNNLFYIDYWLFEKNGKLTEAEYDSKTTGTTRKCYVYKK
jgi:arabinoxylan arabinofuranohydrolase